MPELELDTVFEAGELSTGDVIDSCSSASSHKNNNGGEIISSIKDTSSITRPPLSQNEVNLTNKGFYTIDARHINSNLLVVPNSIHSSSQVTTLIHEPPSGYDETPLKCHSNNLSNQEKISQSETISCSTINKLNYSESNKIMIPSDAKIDNVAEDLVKARNRYT